MEGKSVGITDLDCLTTSLVAVVCLRTACTRLSGLAMWVAKLTRLSVALV